MSLLCRGKNFHFIFAQLSHILVFNEFINNYYIKISNQKLASLYNGLLRNTF
jgi:hypothetical protein